ncbi:MAG TPA: MBL fold metallo-hydrolase [Saprospiraceae bacterium]|nr:MBL fold metallo-hydrolase [Saprospiraceae bacterium]
MKVIPIETGYFKLDGGAMFGVIPKSIWQKMIPADENNLCSWTMRCLLVDTGDQRILIDTGLGDKQDERFFSHYFLHGNATLMSSLHDAGYEPVDITDVILTHFHFDHVGGAVKKNENGSLSPAFPNAKYWTTKKHYDWAFEPNARERASFLKENFVPLKDLGVFHYVPEEQGHQWNNHIRIRISNGHTESMMLPEIRVNDKVTLVYAADLIPSAHHVGLPYIMGYDIRPLVTLEEKTSFLTEIANKGYYLFLEHDKDTECISIKLDAKGRPEVDKKMSLAELLALS